MKKIFHVFVFCVIAFTSAAQWNSINTFATYMYLSSACLGSDTVILAGYDNSTGEGKIVRSYNGGNSWYEPPLPTSTPQLYAISFPSPAVGYTAGQNGTILKTTNTGTNWTTLNTGTTQQITALWFSDTDTGYACGANGLLLKTTNAGNSWTQLTTGTNLILHSVCFPEPQTGYMVAYSNPVASGIILKSTDYGNTWSQQSSPAFGSLFIRGQKVLFINSDTGIIGGLGGAMLHTFDGGQNWIASGAGQTSNNLNNIAYAGSGTFFLCGGTGKILKSTDYGVTITDGGSNSTTADYYAISICDSTGYIFGTNGAAVKSVSVFPGIKEINMAPTISIYPVPCSDHLNVKAEEKIRTLKLLSCEGKLLEQVELNDPQFSAKLKCNTLEAGYYFLTVKTTEGKQITRGFIKD